MKGYEINILVMTPFDINIPVMTPFIKIQEKMAMGKIECTTTDAHVN
jgi:hypothetical protein